MFPVIRLIKEMARFRRASPLGPGEVHYSDHICWPWDLDLWMEMNNGRALTLYDLGRLPMFRRAGVLGALRRRGWGMAVAGASIRYRRRLHMFQRFRMQSAILGWDQRFIYVQQTMWRGDEAASSTLMRMAATCENGILPPPEMAAELGWPEQSPPMPDYVTAWIEADALRPWPPQV